MTAAAEMNELENRLCEICDTVLELMSLPVAKPWLHSDGSEEIRDQICFAQSTLDKYNTKMLAIKREIASATGEPGDGTQAHDLTHYECTSLEYQQKISRFLESMELPQEDQPEAKPSGRTTEARVADPDGDDAELVAKICRAKAVHTYAATEDNELSFRVGQVFTVLDPDVDGSGWGLGRIDGHAGYYPGNYVQLTDLDGRPIDASAAPSGRGRPDGVGGHKPGHELESHYRVATTSDGVGAKRIFKRISSLFEAESPHGHGPSSTPSEAIGPSSAPVHIEHTQRAPFRWDSWNLFDAQAPEKLEADKARTPLRTGGPSISAPRTPAGTAGVVSSESAERNIERKVDRCLALEGRVAELADTVNILMQRLTVETLRGDELEKELRSLRSQVNQASGSPATPFAFGQSPTV